MKKAMVVLVLAAAFESGCEDRGPIACPPYPGVGMVVTVANDQTGGPICDAVVTAQAQDGSSWTMDLNPTRCTYTGSGAGTYSVRAERAGFRPGGLLVRVASSGGECPIALETPVTIRLVALP